MEKEIGIDLPKFYDSLEPFFTKGGEIDFIRCCRHAQAVAARLFEEPLLQGNPDLFQGVMIASLLTETAQSTNLRYAFYKTAIVSRCSTLPFVDLANSLMIIFGFNASTLLNQLESFLTENDRLIFQDMLTTTGTHEEILTVLETIAINNSQMILVLTAFLRLSFLDSLPISEDAKRYASSILESRNQIENSEPMNDEPITDEMPIYDVGTLTVVSDRLGLFDVRDEAAVKHNLISLLCVAIDTSTRVRTVLKQPKPDTISEHLIEGKLQYQVLCPLIVILKLRLSLAYPDLMSRLSKHSIDMFVLSSEIIRPGTFEAALIKLEEFTQKRICPHTYLEGLAALEATVAEQQKTLNTTLFAFSKDFASRATRFRDEGIIALDFSSLYQPCLDLSLTQDQQLQLMSQPGSRHVKGPFPADWKAKGERHYDRTKRTIFTSSDARRLIAIHRSKSLKARVEAIQREIQGKTICDMVTITSVMPTQGISFVNGYYGTSGKEKDPAVWVYEFAEKIEAVTFTSGKRTSRVSRQRFAILAIDFKNADRRDQPFSQLTILDHKYGRVIEWRVFRYDERKSISATHTVYKHLPALIIHLASSTGLPVMLQVSTDDDPVDKSKPLQGVLSPLEPIQVVHISAIRSGHNPLQASLEITNPVYKPTNLDVAATLGGSVLRTYLNMNPPLGHMTKEIELRNRVYSEYAPLRTIHPAVDFSLSQESGTGSASDRPEVKTLIHACAQCATNMLQVKDYILRTLGYSDFQLFLLLLSTAGAINEVDKIDHYHKIDRILSRKQLDDIRRYIDYFFLGIASLRDIRRIASSESFEKIFGIGGIELREYLERI